MARECSAAYGRFWTADGRTVVSAESRSRRSKQRRQRTPRPPEKAPVTGAFCLNRALDGLVRKFDTRGSNVMNRARWLTAAGLFATGLLIAIQAAAAAAP